MLSQPLKISISIQSKLWHSVRTILSSTFGISSNWTRARFGHDLINESSSSFGISQRLSSKFTIFVEYTPKIIFSQSFPTESSFSDFRLCSWAISAKKSDQLSTSQERNSSTRMFGKCLIQRRVCSEAVSDSLWRFRCAKFENFKVPLKWGFCRQ